MLEAYPARAGQHAAARETARYLVVNPPLPVPPCARRTCRSPRAAIGLLPRWARWPLRLPWLPVTEATLGRATGDVGHPGHPLGAAGARPGRPDREAASFPELVLASGSPRRRELLAQLGLDVPRRRPRRRRDAAGRESARSISCVASPSPRRGRSTATRCSRADTIVEVDGEILGKPDRRRRRPADAAAPVRSGSHRVHTGVAVRAGDRVDVEVGDDDRDVRGRSSRRVIDWYIGTGEPFDKAGAYAIQGAGGIFVEPSAAASATSSASP